LEKIFCLFLRRMRKMVARRRRTVTESDPITIPM
jgi:hypothetical protein